MAKCDSPATIKKSLAERCERCLTERLDSEDDLPKSLCHNCRHVHLQKHMLHKLDGLYCFTCAHDYEVALLATVL